MIEIPNEIAFGAVTTITTIVGGIGLKLWNKITQLEKKIEEQEAIILSLVTLTTKSLSYTKRLEKIPKAIQRDLEALDLELSRLVTDYVSKDRN